MPSAWNIHSVHRCHRFLMFVQKKRRKKRKQFQLQLNQNDGTDRNLWKSLSVPAGIALESCVNNTCVPPKKVRHCKRKTDYGGKKKKKWAAWKCLVSPGKKKRGWPVTESAITKGKMRIKSVAGVRLQHSFSSKGYVKTVVAFSYCRKLNSCGKPSCVFVTQGCLTDFFFFFIGPIRDAGLCNAPSNWMNN